jgi:multimeric flavodoxin WrbA
MKKKVVLLNSSKRKRSTLALLEEVAGALTECDTEIITLGENEIRGCTGCEVCITRGRCPIDDDGRWILERIASADGLVIGTPVYLRHISGLLKTLVDRSCSWYHRSPIVGKPVFFVTSTAASGTRQALRYLRDLALQWGAIRCGSLSRNAINADRKPVNRKVLKRFRKYLDAETLKRYSPTLRELIEFNTKKVLALKIIPLDKQYWAEKGYVKTPYFFRCRIGPLKRLIAAFYFQLLNKVIPNRMGDEELLE